MKNITAIMITLSLALLACAAHAGENGKPVPFPADKATGSVTGTVTFKGEAPKPTEILMSDNVCKEAHKDKPPMREDVLVDDKNHLANVFVYVAPESLAKYEFKSEAEHLIKQEGCRYLPHVLGVVVGDKVLCLNGDQTSHNVHTSPTANSPINLAQQPAAKDKILSAEDTEIAIKVKCDVHAWMTAYIFVLPHPKFAITAADGSFKIEGLLPGKYKLCFWHERYAKDEEPKSVEITVEDGKAAKADFELSK